MHGGTLGESEPDFGLKLRNAAKVAKVLSQQFCVHFELKIVKAVKVQVFPLRARTGGATCDGSSH